jgi:hypothetical protein
MHKLYRLVSDGDLITIVIGYELGGKIYFYKYKLNTNSCIQGREIKAFALFA